MKSIKNTLVRSFTLVILITIIVFDILLIGFIKQYFYDNMQDTLKNQVMLSSTLYRKYYSSNSFEESIYNLDTFWEQADAEVQIFDLNGELRMDSIGAIEVGTKYPDVLSSLKGEKYNKWIGYVSYYDHKVMAMSTPLESDGNVIGVLRQVISLKEVDEDIRNIAVFFVSLSMAIVLFAVLLSRILAKNIVTPIKKLTSVAEEMANGDLSVRSTSDSKDEIGKLANTLNYMAAEIANREELKNDFISSVSHELRTPLTAIKGWAITLDNEETDKETLKVGLNIIEKETDRLVSMVEELLDFSKLVSDKITLKIEKLEVKQLKEYIQEYMSHRVVRENKTLTVHCDSKEEFLLADFDRLKQVLINIVDNALKFTEEKDEISITFNINNDKLFIKVKDSGCGISKEDLPRVKEKFYKGKHSKSTNGIGLSICDEIIKLHDGKLKIASIEGEGTLVMVILPLLKEEKNEEIY